MKRKLYAIAMNGLLIACAANGQTNTTLVSSQKNIEIQTQANAYGPQNTCAKSFVTRALPHITKAHGGVGSVYDSNGSGVAVGDLNNDGLEDIVLGNLAGPSHVLWNEGNFKFKSAELLNTLGLPEEDVRAVQIVDINHDGYLDIVFTHTRGAISAFINKPNQNLQGQNKQGQKFTVQSFKNINTPAYSMLWDDLYNNNKLELVTASYNALLEAEMKDSFLLSKGGGVVIYKNTNGELTRSDQLESESQSLALTLMDVNNDGRKDLIVANDFAVPDWAWLNTPAGWKKTKPFKRISKNTMSFSISDTDNNGSWEIFATDMKPDFKDKKTLAAWMPFMQKSYERLQNSSSQRAENVLQRPNNNTYKNLAYQLGIDATGWSWSSQFGDLNNDGFEDLYVVNGMIDKENLKYLPKHELVEKNRAFQNMAGNFKAVPEWGLASAASGRGQVMTDLNNDGRLDIVVNNLESESVIFENQFCGGNSLEVQLKQPKTQNRNAIGAKIILHTSTGNMQRQISSQSGYLSGNSARVHFGFPKNATLQSLEILWPDGKTSLLQNPKPNNILSVTRGETK